LEPPLAVMAFAIDHPIRRRQNPAAVVALPKYDVKIVAGKRIVIFHPEEPKTEVPKPEVPKPEVEAAAKPDTQVKPEVESANKPEVEKTPAKGSPSKAAEIKAKNTK
jgi:hypothetical protein